ncbi:Uncharacterised protein [Mycobacteroides abscessus subsp. abscessus]|nr:Uncharacterised protein [Mycobacteroides abscessus subsp. abscessus]SKU61067.1 Uncharacterised protein [Mycobacteroides abscessus subsp. abscessus]
MSRVKTSTREKSRPLAACRRYVRRCCTCMKLGGTSLTGASSAFAYDAGEGCQVITDPAVGSHLSVSETVTGPPRIVSP